MSHWGGQRPNHLHTGQFAYFVQQLDIADWSGLTVLDFGGNAGNILDDPHCTIERKRYWCLDVDPDVTNEGQRTYPDGHFIQYDRYSFEYNPTGIKGLPIPDLGRKFDVILAYSVFTHLPEVEMRDLVGQLRTFLTHDGILAFTFLDPYFDPPDGWAREREKPGLDNLRCWLEKAGEVRPDLDPRALAARALGTPLTTVTLVNHRTLLLGPTPSWAEEGNEQTQYLVLCTAEQMRSYYPDAEIRSPVRPERHSCCVLRNTPTGATNGPVRSG
jgi:hypothetical protein